MSHIFFDATFFDSAFFDTLDDSSIGIDIGGRTFQKGVPIDNSIDNYLDRQNTIIKEDLDVQ